MTDEPQVSPTVRRLIIGIDRLTIVFSKHWLVIANLSLAFFIGLPVLAPVLMFLGFTGPAHMIYAVYRLTCHELAYRSFFFFGVQPVYPLDQLQAAYGVPGNDLGYWSSFVGNVQLGYKMAWCERDMAIYGSMLAAGLLFGLVRARLRPLNWRIYLLLLVPMAVDGFWQLFTSPEYFVPFLPVHESNWWLRVITGVFMGVGSVWLFYPHLQVAMSDVLDQARGQYARARDHQAASASK